VIGANSLSQSKGKVVPVL